MSAGFFIARHHYKPTGGQNERMTEGTAYAKHLYGDGLDGYLQLAHIEEGNLKGRFVTAQELDTVYQMEGKTDYYITPNSFYRPQRSTSNIRHFRSLYVDLDLDKYDKAETAYSVWLLAEEGKIPKPSMLVDSGRGLHVYWRIEHAPMGAWMTWQALQDHFYKQLRHLGADPQATDSARLLRLPGTINSKNGALCQVLVINDNLYSMYDLREQYLDFKPKTDKPKKKRKGEVSYIRNRYSLHMARLEDLLTLCQLRNYNVTGHRNTILHLFAYWLGVTERNQEVLRNEVIALNERFTRPLKENEVEAVLRCIPKVVTEFLEPTATRNGYNYNNETLIELLEISKQEQQYMKTIIDQQEKYRRNNSRRREARRNEDGLTSREQQALTLKQKVQVLKGEGLAQKEIADRLGVSQQHVSRLLRN
jgi:DNA-binding CsgD family transcriptional regulator